MRIAVVDDEQAIREQLMGYIRRYAHERQTAVDATPFASADALLDGYHGQFDVVLMDIEMRGTDGMTAAARLREIDREAVLIFITNMAQYAIAGYAVRALDYLLKPVAYATLAFKLDRAAAEVRMRAGRSVLLRAGGDSYRFASREIVYFESQRHNLTCHTQTGSVTLRATMRSAQEQTEGLPFAKCNQCYLVNLAYVRAVEGYTLLLTTGDALEISRSRKTPFLAEYAAYLGGQTR